MIAPNKPPIVPPTTAVFCRSLLQVSVCDAMVVLVETAVTTSSAGWPVMESVVGLAESRRSAPMEDVVTLDAVALLQQLLRSPAARQQYLP